MCLCVISTLHLSVSLPVTIDGFLCLPAHKGPQGIKWTGRGTKLFVCLSRCQCMCVEAEAWHLSGWRAYENIGPNSGHISTSVIKAMVTDSQTLGVLSSLLVLLLPAFPKTQKQGHDGCCYICGCRFWAGYIFFFFCQSSVASWLHVGQNCESTFRMYVKRTSLKVLFRTFKASFTQRSFLASLGRLGLFSPDGDQLGHTV